MAEGVWGRVGSGLVGTLSNGGRGTRDGAGCG